MTHFRDSSNSRWPTSITSMIIVWKDINVRGGMLSWWCLFLNLKMLYIFYWLSYDLDNSENITSVMHTLRDSLVSIKYQSKVSIICVLIIVIHPYAYSIQSYCMTFSYLNNLSYIYIYVWFIFVFYNSWSIYCIILWSY